MVRHVPTLGVLAATSVLAVTTLAAPAHADRPAGDPLIVVETTGDGPADFTSVLAGCGSGTVVNEGEHVQFLRDHGMFNGFKVFTCAGAEGGFTVHLSAKFSEDGSTGSWAVTDSWGSMSGLHGNGPLVGVIVPGAIEDRYLA